MVEKLIKYQFVFHYISILKNIRIYAILLVIDSDFKGANMDIQEIKKKKKGEKDFVWSQPGLSIWELSQNEGVTVKSIQKWNELDPSVRVFRTRQRIYLRKVKE